jgi:hypothetical protein
VGNIWVASYTLPEGTLDNVPNLNPSITVTDSAGNATTVQDDANATVDNKINGYSVAINQAYINTANQTTLAFTFANAEVGATYDYDINGIVIGSGIIATPSDMITGIDASSLADGTLTLSAHLTDAAGNVGNTVVALQKPKDTTAPTATAQTSMPAVNLSTVGTQLTVTAKFSEPMNMASMPSISFSPNIISTGTLSLSTMNWVDSKTYQMTYNTHTVPEAQPSVDITVTGGKDQYNNQMASALTAGALSVDTMPLPPPPPPAPTPTPPAPSPSPTPAPTSFTPHASPGDGRQINPNTNEIPGFVAPVVAPAPLAIAPLVEPTFHLTSATLPKAESAGAAPLVTEPTFTPLPTEQVLVPINQPDQSLTNDQLAAAGAAGVDLFSGSKIYLWLLILILLLIFTRVTVALIRREHR